MSEDFESALLALYAKISFTVNFSLTPRGRIRWEARMSGTDFLDGDWETVHSGAERDHKRAMKAAVRSMETKK